MRLLAADRRRARGLHFRLSGPGVNRVITGVGFVGKKSATFTLKRGAYRFVCDPHSSVMKGSFRVR